MSAALLALALLLHVAPAAACTGECPVPGGGAARTDCFVEYDGIVPTGSGRRARTVRCTDGDPACDRDGVPNGGCRFQLIACLNRVDARLPACVPGDVASFEVRAGRGGGDPDVAGLEGAVRALGLPTGNAACAAPVAVRVPLRGRRAFRPTSRRLRSVARTGAGTKDVDAVRFVCRPSARLPRPDATYALAKPVEHHAELIEGPLARGRLGDVLLANERIQVVIQQPGRSVFGIGTYGGNIVDADRQRVAGEERDSFEELLPTINLEGTANFTSLAILNDGSNGEPAVVRAGGPDDLHDFINASSIVVGAGFMFPPGADDRDLPIDVERDYTLAPGTDAVRMDTTVTNLGPAPLDLFLGESLNGSGQVELFQPGYGFGEPLVTTPCPPASWAPCAAGTCDLCNFVAYSGEDRAAGVSYGFVHTVNGSSTFTVSGTTVVLFGNEVLRVLIGAGAANFHLAPSGGPGDALTVTTYFAVGDGSVAATADVRNRVQEVTAGTLDGRVTGDDGAPVALADVAVLAAPFAGGTSANVVDHFRSDADGRYRGTLPAGTFTVRANKDGRRAGTPDPAAVAVVAGATITQDFVLPAPGRLRVTVTDAQGAPIPAKVQLVGFDPSPDPLSTQTVATLANVTGVFGDPGQDGLPFGLAAVAFADPTGDTGVLEIEPGTYRLAVSRGPRWSLGAEDVTVAAGALTTAAVRLARVVDTPGFVASDFHIHAIDSPDCEVTREERVATQLAEGIDFFTPSDHDIRVDFAPTVAAMGVSHLIATAPSAEITTFDYGHFNSWPVTVDPLAVNGGSVDWGRAGIAPGMDFPALGSYGLSPAEIFDAARTDPRPNLVQVNHIDSFFGPDGLDIDTAEGGSGPPQSHTPAAARRLDPGVSNFFDAEFDALEVWNGSVAAFLGQNIGDWFNLLNQGILRAAVADSDTHERRTNGGAVRTWVASAVTDPAALAAEADALAASIVAGRAVGTNAPFVAVTAAAASTGAQASLGPGAPVMLATTDGAVDVTVAVRSPLWAEFDRIELYVNNAPQPWDHDGRPSTRPRYRVLPDLVQQAGGDFAVQTIDDAPSVPGGGHLEASATFHLTGLAADAWIVALVRGTPGVSRPLFPVLPSGLRTDGNAALADLVDGNLGEGGEVALAFTNPLYVDADHDGAFTAPGVRLTPLAP